MSTTESSDARYVAGQLALQKNLRILAPELQDAQMAQRGEYAARTRPSEIRIRISPDNGFWKRQAHRYRSLRIPAAVSRPG